MVTLTPFDIVSLVMEVLILLVACVRLPYTYRIWRRSLDGSKWVLGPDRRSVILDVGNGRFVQFRVDPRVDVSANIKWASRRLLTWGTDPENWLEKRDFDVLVGVDPAPLVGIGDQTRIHRSPGSRLMAVIRFLYAPKTVERVFDPI